MSVSESMNVSNGGTAVPQADSIGPAQIGAAEPSLLRKIFLGPDGLRAGWSLLIFIALMAAMLQGVGWITKHYAHLSPPRPGSELPPIFAVYAEVLPFLGTLLITWIMSKIERRRLGVYGLGAERMLPNFLTGLLWGVTLLSLLVFILWKTGLLVIEQRLLFGADVARYGAIWLLCFLAVGLLEEYLTRGYILYTLTRGLGAIYAFVFKMRHSKALGFWTAALLLSVLFGLGHGSNPGESPIGLLSAGLASLVFCLSLWRTGSLWWAVGAHASWDWAQSFLYGVADSGLMAQHHLLATHPVGKPLLSGGTTGPEGSIFAIMMLLLFAVIIVFTLPRKENDAKFAFETLTPRAGFSS
jgi:uncharacterized protein